MLAKPQRENVKINHSYDEQNLSRSQKWFEVYK